ncbi:MAG TPA: ATP-binding cassette domain-containing protein [Flavobacteriales bacterium]|jgi:phospholipid/cholesterol/gamma-HCH transport system ATP-binding protein|nr:ATP-binding cassette domain-containing protein [Flavobacteriales bacterium]MBK7102335.1 ATP-binding cassette domain-containing protein [Flavobacteriales bacterium]MBK7482930.1 ATP-binding cassette domain-containing protein [Flavobacteriales bacterium]MBK7619306.1 ATP-binding cassette domain-containing protein [Flavobacteriales bacterium]MBK8533249.1 ATP-binding cassette domain-containing protein [Flavobacteriales bacterium]
MIEVKGLSKRFGTVQILTDISAVFETGKVNQIIGKSGSGKSVLAKCMVGLHVPEQGKVLYENRSFYDMDRDQKTEIRQEIGMLFQGSALFDSLTVLQNVMFPLQMFSHKSKSEMEDRAHSCLKRVNILDKDRLFPAELSGGMQKRVGIARAIAMNPKYLFCDEPNSGLDPQTSILIDELIKEITEEFKTTTIVITHDMNSVVETGENIIFIHKGQKWWQGTGDELLNNDNKELNEFIFAGGLMRRIKRSLKN